MDPAVASGSIGAALTVRAAGTSFMLPLVSIAEIIRPLPLTRVPHAPASLLGLANLRGSALPVLSLPKLLGHEPPQATAAARIVVVAYRGAKLGMWVDAVAAQNDSRGDAMLPLGDLLARDFAGRVAGPAPLVRGGAGVPPAAGAASAAPQQIAELASFRVAGQIYAMRFSDLREIIAYPQEIAALGGSDPVVTGLATLRGAALPLVSLRRLLGVTGGTLDTARARIVITHIGAAQIGLIVDELHAVLRVPTDSLDPVPPLLTRGTGETRIEAICRLPDTHGLVALLSPQTLFDDQTTARLAALNTPSAAPAARRDDAAAAQQFLIFQLGQEEYGLPVGVVDEVVRCPATLSRLPHAPDFVSGILNLRGIVVPVIDQRVRLAVAAGTVSGGSTAQGHVTVILTVHGTRVGLRVDAVRHIRAVAAAELLPAPMVDQAGEAIFDRIAVDRAGGRMVLLIDPAVLLSSAARDMLMSLQAGPSATMQA